MVSSLTSGRSDFLSSAPNRVAPPGSCPPSPEFLIAEVADFFDLAFSFLGNWIFPCGFWRYDSMLRESCPHIDTNGLVRENA